MKFSERYKYMQEEEQRVNERNTINEQQMKAIKEQEVAFVDKIYSSRANRMGKARLEEQFKASTKGYLLAECLADVVTKAGSPNVEIDRLSTLEILKGFVEEQGAEKLIRTLKYKTYLLSEMCVAVEEYADILLEKAEEDKEKPYQLKIDNEVNQMLDNLDSEEIEKASEVISNRVSDAVTDFIKTNAEDKARVTAIMDKAQEDVNKTVNEALITSYNKQAKQAISGMRYKRNKSIFEQMVISASKSILQEETKEGVIEDNKISFDKIVEGVTSYYTILETLNTLKVIDIDEAYLEKFFEFK